MDIFTLKKFADKWRLSRNKVRFFDKFSFLDKYSVRGK
jgi:hypothetical protein